MHGIQYKTKCLVGLFLLFHSCTVPDHDLADAAMSAHLESTTGIPTGDWPKQEWWVDFGDPTLTQLIETALTESPTLKKADERLKAAREVARQRWAVLFPELDFDANTNYQHFSKFGFFRAVAPTVPPVLNDITLGLSFHWEFDLWGKNRDLYQAAMGLADAMAAECRQAELILSTAIGYAYAELQFLFCKRNLLQQIENNSRAIVSVRDAREINALDNALVRISAESDLLDVSALLIETQKQIDEEIHRIKALAAIGQDAKVDFAFKKISPLHAALPENLSLDLVARRPDLAAQIARVRAASDLIDAAKTDFYPNINLTAFAGLETIHWNKLFNLHSFSGSLEPAIHLPIFTAGRIRAQLQEKVNVFNEAVYDYNNLVIQAAQEVADAVTALQRLKQEAEVRKSFLYLAEKKAYLISRRVEYALDGKLEYLAVQNSLLQAELVLSEIQYAEELAKIVLIRSLGGGYR